MHKLTSHLLLIICSIYVFGLAVNSVVSGGSGIVLTFGLAGLHIYAVFFRKPTAAAAEAFIFFLMFLMSLGGLVLDWMEPTNEALSADRWSWCIDIGVTLLNLLTALVLARLSEKYRATDGDDESEEDKLSQLGVIQRLTRTKKPLRVVANLRIVSSVVLGVAMVFNAVAISDRDRLGALIAIGTSLLCLGLSFVIHWGNFGQETCNESEVSDDC